ncbi:MAG: hypothetical protein P4N24_02615 [Acidobacteriota bacterium]|nr:hypothetical protein [Acidobacteriota bacterium]
MPHSNSVQKCDFPEGQPGSEQGFYLKDLADGSVVDIVTQHRHYRLVKGTESHVCISGHPTFCPEPIDVEIEGSIGSSPMIEASPGYIGRDMFLVFKHPQLDRIVTTSRIREIHKLR